jgi:hypothetical protein
VKVTRLLVQDFMRVKFVEISPAGGVVRLHGKNAQGKTSLIRAIESALGGKSLHPQKPIREGSDNATVEIDLDDGIHIVAKWLLNGKADLKVTTTDGARYPKAQTLLDGFVGKMAFDPLAFMELEPKQQVEILRKMIGIDFSAIDARRLVAYEARTKINAAFEAAETFLNSVSAPPADTPDDLVSLTDLLAQQDAENAKATAIEHTMRFVSDAKRTADAAMMKLIAARDRVALLRHLLSEAEGEVEKAASAVDRANEQTEKLKKDLTALPEPALDPIRAKLATLEKTNAAVKAKKARALREAEATRLRLEAVALTKQIEAADEEKRVAIAEAKLPVPDLTFVGDQVFHRGKPLTQASHAEQLRISVAMGAALHPKLRVLLIRQGAFLDEDSWALLHTMAAEMNVQVWIEDVGTGGPGFLIEDGEVADDA